MTTEETPAETIERLTVLNNQLAQMLKRGSDRLQESARELLAQGWDAAVAAMVYEDGSPVEVAESLNPYRQPVDLLGGGS